MQPKAKLSLSAIVAVLIVAVASVAYASVAASSAKTSHPDAPTVKEQKFGGKYRYAAY